MSLGTFLVTSCLSLPLGNKATRVGPVLRSRVARTSSLSTLAARHRDAMRCLTPTFSIEKASCLH